MAETVPADSIGQVAGDRTALLASVDDFPAQLSGSALAAASGLPLLLTDPTKLSAQVSTAVAGSGITRVIVLGDQSSISASVVTSLSDLGLIVERVGGSVPQQTPGEVAQWAISVLGFTPHRAAFAEADPHGGGAYALALGPLAGLRHEPVLVTPTVADSGTATQAYLYSVGGALTGGDIAGGLVAIGPEATNSLVADAAGGGGRSDDDGVLDVQVSDLPAGVNAGVRVAGPGGYSHAVNASEVLTGLAPGTYKISANDVVDSAGTTYVPTVSEPELTLAAGFTGQTAVAFGTQIPATTKAVAAADVTAVVAAPSSAPGGTSIVTVTGGPVLPVGDIMGVGVGPATPYGLLVKITATSVSGSTQTLTTVPATLQQAVPRGGFNLADMAAVQNADTGSATTSSLAPTTARVVDGPPTAVQTSGPSTAPSTAPSTSPSTAATAPGNGNGGDTGGSTEGKGGESKIKKALKENYSCGGKNSLSVQTSMDFDFTPYFSAEWSPSDGASATVAATLKGSVDISADVTTAATCTLELTPITPPEVLGVYDLQLGFLPVIIVPNVQLTLEGEISSKTVVSVTLGNTLTATAGISYANGETTDLSGVQDFTDYQQPRLSSDTITTAIEVGPLVNFTLYGVAGPAVSAAAGLDLEANPLESGPWWKLFATVRAGAELTVPALGIVKGNDHLIDRRFLVTQSKGSTAKPGILNEDAAKVVVVPTDGAGVSPPMLGVDGRVWVVAADPKTKATELQAVDPDTYAISTYPLTYAVSGGTVNYGGSAAIDGAGHVWLTAQLEVGSTVSDVLLRYTPGSGSMVKYAPNESCANGANSGTGELYSASDGAVWYVCTNSVINASGGALIERYSSDGAGTVMKPVVDAPLGTLLSLAEEELPGQGVLGPLVAGSGGTMWAISGDFGGAGGILELDSGGQERLLANSLSTGGIALAGSGIGAVVDVDSCRSYGAQGATEQQCYNVINPDGSATRLAVGPDYDGYNDHQVEVPAMDPEGDVWDMMTGKADGDAPGGQYYLDVDSGGGTTVYPFIVPGFSGPIGVVSGAPAITLDGGLWTESTVGDVGSGVVGGQRSLVSGNLVEVVPQGD
ncbi:MAG TPA: cell wall-binding repeat-containing protein [Actinocrinis sp.]|nr:cell wall-binding repeat-containing protein [Actinocrinis sp.]